MGRLRNCVEKSFSIWFFCSDDSKTNPKRSRQTTRCVYRNIYPKRVVCQMEIFFETAAIKFFVCTSLFAWFSPVIVPSGCYPVYNVSIVRTRAPHSFHVYTHLLEIKVWFTRPVAWNRLLHTVPFTRIRELLSYSRVFINFYIFRTIL